MKNWVFALTHVRAGFRGLGGLVWAVCVSSSAFAEDFTLSVEGSDIAFEVNQSVGTNAETLVLLHSGLLDRESLRHQIDYFSSQYRVVAIDTRGHGRSSASPGRYQYQTMADDVLAVLDFLEVERVSIIGQSDGGITALTLAANHADRLNKLVLVGAIFNFDAIPLEHRGSLRDIDWASQTGQDGFFGGAVASYLKHEDSIAGMSAFVGEMSDMWSVTPNFTVEALSEISTPTLIVNGDRYDAPHAHVIAMYEAMPNAELFIVPGASHFLHEEKPELFNAVVDDFLAP
jgi:pimeloyl-ACP methyl ester carboxylesterase